MIMHVQQTLPFPWQGGRQCSLQLLIQPWICAPGTHYGWVDRGSVEYEVYPTLLHMASTGNRTPDLLILSPTPYPLGHMLPQVHQILTFTNYHEVTHVSHRKFSSFLITAASRQLLCMHAHIDRVSSMCVTYKIQHSTSTTMANRDL